VKYEVVERTGKGSFGVVFKAVVQGTNTIVAIKRVLQDPKYKNREEQIMKMVSHFNTVQLISSSSKRINGKEYLHLVLGYIPKNLYEVCSSYAKRNEKMPMVQVQLYIYQLCRSLAYVHSLGICHRDIKPQNLLIHPETNELKLCDFGSAKILVKGEPNVAYICSRYYRAPELIFGAGDYTTAIDVWSAGCVMAELILGHPIFAGESGIDQLVEIIKVLGTPTREEIYAMNRDYKDNKQFPSIKPHPWHKYFLPETPESALDLMAKMLVYTPPARIKPLEACAHLFFDDLRKNDGLSSGINFPSLFDFSHDELAEAKKQCILEKLLPTRELEKLTNRSTVENCAQPEPEPEPKPTPVRVRPEELADSEGEPDADSDP